MEIDSTEQPDTENSKGSVTFAGEQLFNANNFKFMHVDIKEF